MNYKRIIKVCMLTAMLILVLTIVSIGSSNSKVGSTEDPLVTLSYVEMRFEAFNEHVANQIQELKNSIVKTESVEKSETDVKDDQVPSTTPDPDGDTRNLYTKYVVVEVEANKKITFGESTEIILRGGSAKAMISDQGGLSDLTDGVDIQAGVNIPLNHLILIPRDDGRGFVTDKKVWVMVKGEYKIEDQ